MYDRADAVIKNFPRPVCQQVHRSLAGLDAHVDYLGDAHVDADPPLHFIGVANGEVQMVGSSGDQKQVELDFGYLDLDCAHLEHVDIEELLA